MNNRFADLYTLYAAPALVAVVGLVPVLKSFEHRDCERASDSNPIESKALRLDDVLEDPFCLNAFQNSWYARSLRACSH